MTTTTPVASATGFIGFSPCDQTRTMAELDGIEVARAIHFIIRHDPDMPVSLRTRLAAYAGLLLDGRDRAELTPAGHTAVEMAEAAGLI